MAEPNRPTVSSAEMTDVFVAQPAIGQEVWALTKGGTITRVVWNSASWEFFEAWYPFLKIPESVKIRMSSKYKPKENDDARPSL